MKKYFGICLLMLLFSMVCFAEQPRVVENTKDHDIGLIVEQDSPITDCTMVLFMMNYQMVGLIGEFATCGSNDCYCGIVCYPRYAVIYHSVDLTGTSNPPSIYNQQKSIA